MSKELFFNMRAEDMALMYSENFTKKDAEKAGVDLVNTVLENGLIEPKKVFSNIVRLKSVIDSADKAFRDELSFIFKESYNGVEFTPTNPRESLNYEEDEVWVKLKKQLTDREDLLKTAKKATDSIPDTDGCEVPRVSSKFTKSSITIKF